jgi:hypothetical protein
MKNMILGPIQEKVITDLERAIDTASNLARRAYGLEMGAELTRSQRVSIHRTLRVLERNDFVRLTNQFRQRERCWELTGKMKAAPPLKGSKPRGV